MKYKILGKTNYKISEVSYGAWSLGADWGKVSEKEAMTTLNAAIDSGVNFIDTADVYGNGLSEKRVAKLLKQRKERIYVATKVGRRLNTHNTEGYNKNNLNQFVERSRKYLNMDTLDLVQLHCPPTQVFYNPEVFEVLEIMKQKKKIRCYGVSVEKVEEALKAIEYQGVDTVQIIFNIFRQRPSELFFQQAQKRNIGIIVRVPLASGLLTGKMTKQTKFSKDDHRNYNRKGQAFDIGETFAGVPFETGLKAVEEIKKIKPEQYTMPQFALKWILMHKAVSTVIPGGKSPQQVEDNIKTSSLPNIIKEDMNKLEKVYSTHIKPHMHYRW